ncbi:unnamed protein product [Brassica oleracea var. botrytis]
MFNKLNCVCISIFYFFILKRHGKEICSPQLRLSLPHSLLKDSLVAKLWRLPGDESTAELKVDFTPSSHMCSSSTSHHLRNLAVTLSARVRRQSSLTERRKILPKSPLFFFIIL